MGIDVRDVADVSQRLNKCKNGGGRYSGKNCIDSNHIDVFVSFRSIFSNILTAASFVFADGADIIKY